MKNENYFENELGKVPDCVKKVELKSSIIDTNDGKEKKVSDILSGKHDNDFWDKEKFPTNSYWIAYHKASKMINWAELSRILAVDRSSITNERVPQKHVAKIHELRKAMTTWILENDPQFNK